MTSRLASEESKYKTENNRMTLVNITEKNIERIEDLPRGYIF